MTKIEEAYLNTHDIRDMKAWTDNLYPHKETAEMASIGKMRINSHQTAYSVIIVDKKEGSPVMVGGLELQVIVAHTSENARTAALLNAGLTSEDIAGGRYLAVSSPLASWEPME
jgi:hypothetical protein